MMTLSIANISKKAFAFDKDYLIVMVLFILVLFSAKAFASISAPEQVIVSDKTVFLVDITNDSSQEVDLTVNFFAPIKSEIVAPSSIPPKSTISARITLYNTKFSQSTQINATIEADMRNKVEKKEVALKFTGEQYNQSPLNAMFASLFSFTNFVTETANFSLAEWAVFWILIIISAILVVAFVSRVKNRV